MSLFGLGGSLTSTPGNTYTSYIIKKVKLDIQAEGQGVVTSDDFTCSWNPRPYACPSPFTSLTDLPYANPVSMMPDPCPGWGFDHWEYKDAAGAWIECPNLSPGYPQNLSVYMNWWPGNGIHVPDGEPWLVVKAVFLEACFCTGYEGADALRAQYDVVLARQQGVLYPKPPCDHLVTNIAGHYWEYQDPGNFTYADLDCNHGASEAYPHSQWQVDHTVSDIFQAVLDEYGIPIRLTCAYHCPTHNNNPAVSSGSATSLHPKGEAFDFNNQTSQANWNIAVAAGNAGCERDSIYLYKSVSGSTRRSLQWLLDNNCNATTFPETWTGYALGHIEAATFGN